MLVVKQNNSVASSSNNDLVEMRKEDYYRASQLFFQKRQHLPLQSADHNQMSSDCSLQSASSGTSKPMMNSDWNEIGLPPLASAGKYFQSRSDSSSVGSGCGGGRLRMATTSSDQSSIASCDKSVEHEVKFKLGGKVRTYKKPRPSTGEGKFPLRSMDLNPAYETFETSAISSKKPEANELPSSGGGGGNSASTSAAPYYYSDLLSEEQKIALQKKLSNFASPPPLLSRCTALDTTRYLGMTSLCANPKISKLETKNNGPINGMKKTMTDVGVGGGCDNNGGAGMNCEQPKTANQSGPIDGATNGARDTVKANTSISTKDKNKCDIVDNLEAKIVPKQLQSEVYDYPKRLSPPAIIITDSNHTGSVTDSSTSIGSTTSPPPPSTRQIGNFKFLN